MQCTVIDEDLFESGHVVQNINVTEAYRNYLNIYVDAVKDEMENNVYTCK